MDDCKTRYIQLVNELSHWKCMLNYNTCMYFLGQSVSVLSEHVKCFLFSIYI